MRAVLIDTDPGVDDALALLLAFAAEALEVIAVTVVAGNAALPVCLDNARRLLRFAPTPPPPLFPGADRPLAGPSRNATHVHGDDGLGGSTLLRTAEGHPKYPAAEVAISSEPAAEALVRLSRERGAGLTVIALGPLTNLALALRADSECLARLGEVIIMGGAFRCPGNAAPVAEFNIWADPEAAQAVCDSGARLRWVPLDVTRNAPLTTEHLAGLQGPRAEFVCDLTRDLRSRASGGGEEVCLLHDSMAVGAALWPALYEFAPLRVDVERRGELTRGMTVADFRGGAAAAPNSGVALGADMGGFRRRFLAAINQPNEGL